MMGVEFFRKATKLQEKYGKNGAVVSNGLQTNAQLIDDEFADHFAKYKFLLGISLDGPEAIHNFYRKDLSGRGSHAQVMKAVDTLEKHNVEFNILSLASAANVNKPKELYEYYQEHGFNFLQFIPCVEFDNHNKPLPFSITGKQWGEFLCEIFDIWIKKDTRKVSIRFFDSIMALLVDNVRNICHIGRNCCQYFVVEHNGDVYPCDFFVNQELKLGNICETSWEELQESPLYKHFGADKAKWQSKCAKCEFLSICSGDCLKHRIYGTITTPENLSWLCEGWEMFYRHSLPGFKKLAEEIKKERIREEARQMAAKNPQAFQHAERNTPCPCGSGKKFKKCCGRF